jgi:FAD synthase
MRISGVVIKGNDKGKGLGFPTANLELKEDLDSGVYSGKVFIGEREYKAGLFIRKDKKILEAHILDFNGDLYGREIEVEIGEKVREAMEFNSDEELREQIEKDLDIIKYPFDKGGVGGFINVE